MTKYTVVGIFVGAVVGAALGLFLFSEFGGSAVTDPVAGDPEAPTNTRVLFLMLGLIGGAAAGGLWGAANWIAERRFAEEEARRRAGHGGRDSHDEWIEPTTPRAPS